MKNKITGIVAGFAGVLVALLLVSASVPAQEQTPTYYGDVAPLLSRSCVSCHRSGGSAPFALSSFIDAKRRATQLVQVTQSNFMPPWITTTTGFCGERLLTTQNKDTLKQWTQTGMPEGNKPANLPAPPKLTDWPLGTPDMIVTMPKTYTLTPNTLENTRCFLLPKPLKKDVRLRAIAFRPQNLKIVRYVNLYEDKAGVGRKQEAISGAVGYFGFTGGLFPSPMGSLADWSPGSANVAYPLGVGVSVSKDSDLIVQVRFHATGKAEEERMQVGLYFAEEATPIIEPVTLRIGKAELYLPKNSTATLRDSFVLPVEASLFEIVPNAHILGRTILVTATLPDGGQRTLLDIPDWNVDWKQPYRYAKPEVFPAGTRFALTMTFDNTHKNPKITYARLRGVSPALEFMEEMSSVWLRLIPTSSEDRDKLVAALPNAKHRPAIHLIEFEPEGQGVPKPLEIDQ